MQALILAAGRGSRLGELTQDKPKGLTPLLNKPLIEWQFQAIQHSHINKIAIATGYLQQHFASYSTTRFHNPAWESSNMVRTLLCCDKYLAQDTTIISYSDIIYSSDTITKLQHATGDIVISYDPNWLEQWQLRFDDPLKDAETFVFNDHKLLHIGQKAQTVAEIQGQYMGLLKLTTQGWHLIKTYLNTLDEASINKLDMTTLLEKLLQANKTITLSENEGFWFEIDSIKDLEICERLLKNNI